MSFLLDVNLLIACGWQSHNQHAEARKWLEAQASFATCPFSELGFLRVSLSPAFRAAWDDAKTVLDEILQLPGAQFVTADLNSKKLPTLTSGYDVTDAYLIALSRAHRLRLATLDDSLCRKPWAAKVAVNPLARSAT